jgi:hypothetical protein
MSLRDGCCGAGFSRRGASAPQKAASRPPQTLQKPTRELLDFIGSPEWVFDPGDGRTAVDAKVCPTGNRLCLLGLCCSVLVLCATVTAADALTVFGVRWTVPVASDWKISRQDGTEVLSLVQNRGPLPGPRRPIQFALADEPSSERVTVEAEVKPLGRSLLVVFAYQDAAHFDYAHLSADTGAKQPVHNGIFHVYGGERVRISSERGPAAFAETGRWYRVKLVYDGGSGRVRVTVDGQPVPALEAVDVSLGAGRVGIGSFDETGEFRNVRITPN